MMGFRKALNRISPILLILLLACTGEKPDIPTDSRAPFPQELLLREAAIRELHRQAEDHWNQGRFDEARSLLGSILAEDPDHPLAYQGVVQIQLRRGELDLAEGLLEDLAGSGGPGLAYGRGVVRLFQGRNAEAQSLFKIAYEAYSAAGHPSGEAACLTGLGIISSWTSRYEEALGNYERAARLVEGLGDLRSTADLLGNLAAVRKETGDEDKALTDFRRAREIQEEIGDRDGLSASFYNIGLILHARGENAAALESLQSALAINRQLGDRASEAKSINSIGLVHLDLGGEERAAASFSLALDLAREAPDPRTEADARTNLGLIDQRAGRNTEALGNHLEALAIRRELGDRAGEAASLYNAGLIHETMGAMPEALKLYDASLNIYREVGNLPGEALLLKEFGRIDSGRGEREEAIGKLREAVKLYRAAGEGRGEASAHEELGRALTAAADYSAAQFHLERSLELRRGLGDRRGIASGLHGLGVLKGRLGEFQEADELFRGALEYLEEFGDRRAEAATLNDLANVWFARGDFTEALRLQGRSLEIRRDIGDIRGAATNLNNIGAIYRSIGDGQRATHYVRRSLDRMRELSDRAGEALARNNLGVLLEDDGDLEGARREFQESVRIREEIRDRRGAAFSRHNLAGALHLLGRPIEARDSLERSLGTFREIGDRGGEALALVGLGEWNRAAGELETARKRFREALDLAGAAGMDEAVFRSEAGLASCLEADGRWREALEFYQRAISGVETLRGRLVSEEFKASFLAQRIDLYGRVVDLLWNHGPLFLGAGGAERAFEYAEKARARSLLDLLVEARSDLRRGLDPGLLGKETQLLARIAQLGKDLRWARGERDQKRLRGAIERAEEELELLKVAIRQAAPGYAEITYPEPATAGEVRGTILGPGEILLEYLLGEKASYLWGLTREEIRHWELPPRSEIEPEVRRFLGVLRSEGADLGPDPAHLDPARRLAAMLLPPGSVPPGARVLVIPDGILHYLPFEALILPGSDEGREEGYLVEGHQVSYAPSASSLRFLRERGSGQNGSAAKLFAMGDPQVGTTSSGVWETSPLPFAREEISGIGQLFPEKDRSLWVGSAAGESVVKSADLGSYRYLHFAAHGWIDEEEPGRSGIFLGTGSGGSDDGLLQMNEIFQLRLGVDLAVLSGCRTGLGSLVRGEGIVGLTRSFLYAGARSVVVSLWNVNDRSTSVLMREMYRRLILGESPDAALQGAKLALLRSATTAYRHPARWAPFILIGGPGGTGGVVTPGWRKE